MLLSACLWMSGNEIHETMVLMHSDGNWSLAMAFGIPFDTMSKSLGAGNEFIPV